MKKLSLPIRFGLVTSAVLIAYFLILRAFSLHENPWLRLANGVFMCLGIYFAIKTYKSISGDEFSYINGTKTALITGFIATVIFTVFMAIYMYQIDSEFAAGILKTWGLEYELGTFMLLLTILIMGFATTLVLTLAFMQLLKKSWNTKDGNRNTL